MTRIVSIIFSLSILFCANAKPKLVTCLTDTTEVTNSNVNYKVTHNEDNVYLNISTTDMSTLMAMLRTGVIVYFDITGKTKENVSIKYPLEPLQPKFETEKEQFNDDDFGEFEPPVRDDNVMKQNIDRLIKNDLPEIAEYHFFDRTQEFHILLNTLNITLSYMYTYDADHVKLEYQLTIPKLCISETPQADFRKLSIGIKTGTPTKFNSENNERPRPDRDMNRGPGGLRGAGGPPPRMDNMDEDRRPQNTTINFWFDAKLKAI